jgi:putative Holliday junction resolvase
MGRILALDIGERRVGLAWSGPGETYALPAGFLEVRDVPNAIEQIASLIVEESPSEVVVGLPLNMDGSESAGVRKVNALLEGLAEKLPEPVIFRLWDERLTSHQAQSMLVDAELKHSGKRRRGRVDAVAAACILQSYLDSRATDRNTIRIAGMG